MKYLNKRILLIGIMFSITCFCYGQRYDKDVIPYSDAVSLLTDKGRINVSLLSNGKRIKVKETSWYSWYKRGEIQITQGSYQGRLLHGNYLALYNNKASREKGQFRFGLKDGKWFYWDPNGALRKVSEWKDGTEAGKFSLYSVDGTLMETGRVKNGELNGIVRNYTKRDTAIVVIKKFREGEELEDWEPSLGRRLVFKIMNFL